MGTRLFESHENLCPDGWLGWWVGGDQKGPSIFLIFKYVNKQDVLIPKMVLKVVNDFCMGLKILFEVWGRGSQFSKLH